MVADSPNSIIKLWNEFHHSPLQAIHRWQSLRTTWLIMLATATFLELCALGFQYILNLQPCELCVYQRLAVMMLMFAPLIMMTAPGNIFVRIAGYGVWIWGAVYGLEKALIQSRDYANFDPLNSTCNFRPIFPFDLPLYEWLPSVFMPTGLCGEDSWSLLSLNMAQWMALIFAIYILAAVVSVISSLHCWIAKK